MAVESMVEAPAHESGPYKRKLRLTGVGLILLAGAYLWTAVSYGVSVEGGTVEAGAAPFFMGSALIMLSVILIIGAARQSPAESKTTQERRAEVKKASLFFASLAGYAVLVAVIGFIAATLVSVAGMLRFFFGYSVRRMILYSGALTLLCYLIFDLALGVNLP